MHGMTGLGICDMNSCRSLADCMVQSTASWIASQNCRGMAFRNFQHDRNGMELPWNSSNKFTSNGMRYRETRHDCIENRENVVYNGPFGQLIETNLTSLDGVWGFGSGNPSKMAWKITKIGQLFKLLVLRWNFPTRSTRVSCNVIPDGDLLKMVSAGCSGVFPVSIHAVIAQIWRHRNLVVVLRSIWGNSSDRTADQRLAKVLLSENLTKFSS